MKTRQTFLKLMPAVLLASGLTLFNSNANADSDVAHAGNIISHTSHGDMDSSKYPKYPVIDYSKVANPDLIKKGEYLAKAGDCMACHTAKGGKPFAGGLGIETPFGAFYSPNITADPDTGIGKWSDKQFIEAVRYGNGPHGNLFPVFPYVYYNKMSDADVLAIKAYLFAVPKVHQEATPNQVPWPFNVRFAQYPWKIMFFYPYEGEYQYDKTKSAQWNRGAYLVEGPGHCGMCHSPLNFLGAEKRKYRYTGGFVGAYYAPDITSSGIGKYPVDEVIRVFKEDRRPGGGKIQAEPMLEVNNDSLKYLSDDDLRSIVVYLQSIHSEHPPVSHEPITPATGKKIYNKYCSGCHANGGNGAPIFGDKAEWQKRMQQGMQTVIDNAIKGFNSMPPKGNCATCTNEEIQATVEYMVNNSISSTAKVSKPTDYYAGLPHLTMAQGKALYQEHCSVCHDKGTKGNAPKIGDVNAWSPILRQDFDDVLTTVIKGKSPRTGNVHPCYGACSSCKTSEIIAATKYLAQQSSGGKYDFSLW